MRVENQSLVGWEEVRVVGLQFRFTNEMLIPGLIRGLPAETVGAEKKQTGAPTGREFIASTQNVGVEDSLEELEALGFVLVDAFYQKRAAFGQGKAAYITRFVFARKEFARPKPEFLEICEEVRFILEEMLFVSMWATQAYVNPLYVEGEVVEGESSVMVNMTARNPLFQPDGQPIMVWASGAKKEKVPVSATTELHFLPGSISLLPACRREPEPVEA